MTTMTSRQRVLAALDRDPVDRVPIDFGATRVSGIAAIAYNNLLNHLGMKEIIRLYDIKQQLALPSLEMIDRLGGDVIQLNRLGPTTGMPFLTLDRWKSGQLTDGATCMVPDAYDPVFLDDGTIEIERDGRVMARRPLNSLYFDVCAAPLQHAETTADIDAWEFPDPWSEREDAFLEQQIDRFYRQSDKALFGGLPLLNCSFLEIGVALFGFETYMMNLMLKRDLMEYWMDRMLEHDMDILDSYLKIAGPYLCAIQLNDDIGAQDALQVSPGIYREMIKPRQKKWIEFVKARTNAKIFIHCDGAIEEILPDFIEIGIDILNPLQTNARGMDPERIKKKYGDNIAFWGGGVETQTTLPFGAIDDIKSEVRDRIELLGRDGGYVFATIHNIQADIPPEKILAIFDTARDYRF